MVLENQIMPCCTYYSESELDALYEDIKPDQELRELLDEVNQKTDGRYHIHKRTWQTGWFKKKTHIGYDLLSDMDINFGGTKEVQIINFGPNEVGGCSIGGFVNRQTIAGYLFGRLNGYRAGQKSSSPEVMVLEK